MLPLPASPDPRGAQGEPLHLREQWLDFLLRSTPGVIFRTDVTRVFAITMTVGAVEELFGYSVEELTGDPEFWHKRVHPEDLPRLLEIIPLLLERRYDKYEYRFRFSDGSYRWISDERTVILDLEDRAVEIVGIWTDITPNKQILENLLETQEWIQHVLASSPAMFYSLRSEGKRLVPVWVSESIVPLLGYTAEDAMKRTWWRSCLHPDDRLQVRAAQERLFDTGFMVQEYRFLRKDGSYLWLRDEARVVGFKGGKPAEIVGSFWDISDSKQEKEIILQAKDSAEQASRAKSEFLAHMSHELRTPLNSIIGFSEVLADRTFGPLNDKQAQYVGHVLSSGRHLLSLINDLLDLAKIEAERAELELEATDLSAILADTINSMMTLIEKQGLHFSMDIGSPLPPVLADSRRIKQIIFNLLSNAVKFTPPGGRVAVLAHFLPRGLGSMGEMAREAAASGRLSSEACVWISVVDTGIGIRPEHQKRLFKPFEQLDSSPKRILLGTGLGLALTRKLIEAHDGRVWVESAGEGWGCTFHLALPVARPAV
jgi:PAS domain S-box-containing protein